MKAPTTLLSGRLLADLESILTRRAWLNSRRCVSVWSVVWRATLCLTRVMCLLLFLQACSLCNEAIITYDADKYKRIGEPTEAALKVLVEKLGIPGKVTSSLMTLTLVHRNMRAPPSKACRTRAAMRQPYCCRCACCWLLPRGRLDPARTTQLPSRPRHLTSGRRSTSALRCWSSPATARA